MKKHNILDVGLATIIILHLIYAVYMFTVKPMYGILWTMIAVIEGLIYLAGLRKVRFLKIVLAVIICLQLFASLFIMVAGSNARGDDYDRVLVLGYELHNNEMSETLRMRLDKAYKYSQDNPDSIFILCGGVTRENTISEASVMKDYLTDKGLDESRIILEDKSQDTIENIANSLQYINKDNKVLVISSNYHVYRARMIASKAGVDASGLGSSAPFMLIPNQLLFEKLGIIGLMMN